MKQKTFKINEGTLVHYQRAKAKRNGTDLGPDTDPTATVLTTATTGFSRPVYR